MFFSKSEHFIFSISNDLFLITDLKNRNEELSSFVYIASVESNFLAFPNHSLMNDYVNNFSEDIVNDILLRCPVKSLLRFKCVCKTDTSLSKPLISFNKTRRLGFQYSRLQDGAAFGDAQIHSWRHIYIATTIRQDTSIKSVTISSRKIATQSSIKL